MKKLRRNSILTAKEKEDLKESIKMGTKQWAKRNLNIFTGCFNNCYYCYARNNSHRFSNVDESRRHYDRWGDPPIIHWERVNKRYMKVKTTEAIYDYMFQSSSDLFPNQLDQPYYDAILTTLTKVLEAGNTVLITTKPRFSVMKSLVEGLLPYRDLIGFRFTIGSKDSAILKKLEPNAPSFEERLKASHLALIKGYPTTFSIEPLLDEQPYDLINVLRKELSPLDVEKDQGTIWLGLFKTRYTPKWAIHRYHLSDIYERIVSSQKFEAVYRWYEHYFNDEVIRFKESVTKLMIDNNIKIRR